MPLNGKPPGWPDPGLVKEMKPHPSPPPPLPTSRQYAIKNLIYGVRNGGLSAEECALVLRQLTEDETEPG